MTVQVGAALGFLVIRRAGSSPGADTRGPRAPLRRQFAVGTCRWKGGDSSPTARARQAVFADGIPDEVLEELLARARERLDRFEDGTPLPAAFRTERAV
jgi:hypothetical protein